MWRLLLSVGLIGACGGSGEPARTTPPTTYLPSEAVEDNTPRQKAPPPPPRQPVDTEVAAAPVARPAEDPGPPPPVDGVYSPLYVRVNSTKLLDQRITVKGTVVWVYDCVADVAAQKPDQSRDEVRKLVAKRPELCKRPHFKLGEHKATPVERAILVAEVPRALRPDERISLPKDEAAASRAVPSITVGQQLTVEGTWALNSPKGFASRDGLLVYGRLVP